ncbi:hypothetical protein TNIN_232921 [Trichonephila inaurata madagascariensis]|uniref:Uncharacterized protein n=1 Tax=Trichonephila inaurata madagascariensis TaxID=2747483 RepID=A0A8X6X659_9ARAC|nr:hypothetical protein TNIN_232921 [Trichonephila inaurata madagascariensis]
MITITKQTYRYLFIDSLYAKSTLPILERRIIKNLKKGPIFTIRDRQRRRSTPLSDLVKRTTKASVYIPRCHSQESDFPSSLWNVPTKGGGCAQGMRMRFSLHEKGKQIGA